MQEKQETQTVQTVTINENIYNISDLSKEATDLINDITLIQNIIKDKNTEIAINNIARDALMQKLILSVEEVLPVGTTLAPEKAE